MEANNEDLLEQKQTFEPEAEAISNTKEEAISNTKEEAQANVEDKAPKEALESSKEEIKGEATGEERLPDEPWMDWTNRIMFARAKLPPNSLGKRRPSTEGLNMEQYVAKHEAAFNKLLSFEPEAGWTLNREVDGTLIYTKQDPDSPLNSFKAICMMESREGIHDLVAGLSDVLQRKHWDEMVIESANIEAHTPFYRVSYSQIESQSFLLSRRDLCLLGRVRWEKDGSCLMAIQDCDDPALNAERPGFVRAKMTGGYIIRPTDRPEVFKVIWTGTVDAGGWIPSAIANLVAWKQGLTLKKYATWAAQKNPRRISVIKTSKTSS